ncbi:NADPH:quinone oxidoreductase [Hyphomicrobium methylovorum]|uniref:NADPH:quinone oxidoreductase family protein n=1 Tax=Hyphomicrobium methylovorum TaxID=84 RepID=UPI0015E710FA|nr:NADPH:quinone oxidoreductase family protein [Hyphomicrobium methylovorum]MBA2126120.1 NADPH:quinone oxidoreductase [Hyphomicrobium methylovorum]
MKAALCKTLDGPPGLVIEDVPEPHAKPGQAIVRVKAVGLNFADTLITRGKYQFKPELPFSPGAEIAGEIEHISGEGAGLALGQRVMAYVNWGGAAEKIAVDLEALITVPDAVPLTTAAGLPVTFGTAIHGLRDRGRLQPGETVVVTGAAGGAGQAAVEIAKLMGARVIAVASSPEKCAIATAAGADETLEFPSTDLKAGVRALTGGDGADIIYDCVGGPVSEPLLRALRWQGRFLVVGFASGEIPKIPLNLLMLKGAEASGVFWGDSVRRDPAGHRANMRQLLEWVADGRLKPVTHGLYALDSIKDALAILDRREAAGKVVLTIGT